MDLQEKLNELRRSRAKYLNLRERPLEAPGLLAAFEEWYEAAKNLYDAIVQTVKSGKTVILKSEDFFSGQIVIRNVGIRYNTDCIMSSDKREAKYVFGEVRMSAAETIEVLDE